MKAKDLKAVLIGATGLVGSEILKILLQDPQFSSVLVFTRRSTGVRNLKLEERIVDFEKMSEWKQEIQGDVAFSALGTTRAQAGSIRAQYQVDFTYQAEFARACAQNGVPTFILISSMGADIQSRIPYSRMKGELEDFVESLGFQHIQILRPGPLQGPREKKRWAEDLALPMSRLLSHLPPFRDIHPVSGHQVARTAVNAAFSLAPLKVFNPSEVRLGI